MSEHHDDLELAAAAAGAPGLASLSALLRRLDGTTVDVVAPRNPNDDIRRAGGVPVDESMIDQIHEGLLRKQRAGSLGLNK